MLAAVIWSEIGDLRRFDSADALVNHTGLVPSLYNSGEVSITGPITRQGPAWLRWALITAANALTRSRSPLGTTLLAIAAPQQASQCGQDRGGVFGRPLRLRSFETRSTFPGRTLGPESRQARAVSLR